MVKTSLNTERGDIILPFRIVLHSANFNWIIFFSEFNDSRYVLEFHASYGKEVEINQDAKIPTKIISNQIIY